MIFLYNLFELNPIKKIPLRIYLEKHILPIYDNFDKGHSRDCKKIKSPLRGLFFDFFQDDFDGDVHQDKN